MAKKVLTPEQQEIKAIKKEKRGQNWTKFWAIFLALVLTLAIAFAGKTTGEKLTGGTAAAAETSAASVEETTLPKGEGAVSEGETVTLENGETVVGLSKADAIKLLNDATAGAANKSYDWKRTCNYKQGGEVNLGSDTLKSILNGVISKISADDNVDTVVGGFIGIGSKDGKATGGKLKYADGSDLNDMDSGKFPLKAMKLTEADVKDFVQEGNVYKFQLNACSNPQKDNNNALHHATNDFITKSEVDKSIADFTTLVTVKDSSTVDYSNIVITATISNGVLTNLEISYDFTAKLDLSVQITTMTGSGAAETKITYSNIA